MKIKLLLILIGVLILLFFFFHNNLTEAEFSSDGKAILSFVVEEENLTNKPFSTNEVNISPEEESHEQKFLIKIYEHENITPLVEKNLDKNTDVSLNPGLYRIEIISENKTSLRGYNLSKGEMVVVPLYINTQQRDFVSDAPWRVEPNQKIPILFEIKDVLLCDYDLGYIKIYLDSDKDEDNDESDDRLLKKIWYGASITEGDWHDDYKLALSGYDESGNYYNLQDENYLHIVFEENDGWDDCFDINQHFHIKVKVDDEYLKKIDKWYCGDTHFHSSHTDTSFEFGGPVDTTIDVLKALGLDWVTITDHSNSFSNHRNDDLRWENFKVTCNSYNECLLGTEINCDYKFLGGGNHLLSYNYNNFIDDKFNGWVPLPGFDMVPGFDNPSCSEMINEVYSQGGFTYAAHPETVSDPFGFIIDKWHNYSLPFSGLEVWNEDINHATKSESIINALEDGLFQWKKVLLTGRKVFISAGSDAHGDFNTDFGKEYTCVYAPYYSKQNIFDGLKNGNSFISNNGALILKINSKTIGGETNIKKGTSFSMNIDYNIENNCYLKIYKGVIGQSIETYTSLGWLYPRQSSTTYSDAPPSKSYYRAECISSDGGKRIYTNPIWIVPINCYQNSDCGVDSSNKFCNQNRACEETTIPTCYEPGTEQSYCSSMFVGGCDLPCPFGCNESSGECKSKVSLCLINSPKNNTIYSNRRVSFSINGTEKLENINYIDYADLRPRWTRLCLNCDNYNNDRNFIDGKHKTFIKCNDYHGTAEEKEVSFFIDSKPPKISSTKPQSRKYTNGSDFYVKYTEENVKYIKLKIAYQISSQYNAEPNELEIQAENYGTAPATNSSSNGNDWTVSYVKNCPSGMNRECYFSSGLKSQDDKIITYKFEITDIANNTDESNPTKIKVDTTSPEIKDLKAPISGRYVYFNMTILNEDKNSFNKVEYIDNSELRPSWRALCTSLKNNICYKRVSFRPGNHELVVRASDKAGNSDFEALSLKI